MMKYTHQNFYRKHRPRTFQQVVGQSFITNVLRQQIQRHKLNHAYLFAGIQGIGKTTTARILARAMNCLDNQLGEPCAKCAICQKSEHNFGDIIEIDAASHNGVEQIRELREKVYLAPTVARYKVYIIDEVHMLSKGAANAFLKILEEPPRHVIFILATTELFKIPPTLTSRCQIFVFRALQAGDMLELLKQIAEAEGVVCEPEALQTLGHHAGGSARDAVNLLEQMAFLQKGTPLTTQNIEQQLGQTNQDLRFKFLQYLLKGKKKATLEVIEEFAKISNNFERLRHDLIEQVNTQMLEIYRQSDMSEWTDATKQKITQFQTILETLLDSKYQINTTALSSLTFFQLLTLELFRRLHPQLFILNKTPPPPPAFDQFQIEVNKNQNLSSLSKDISPHQMGLHILRNKLIPNIKAIKEIWTQLSISASQPIFQIYVKALLKVRPIATSADFLLVCSEKDNKLRDEINSWNNTPQLQKFMETIFAQKLGIFAVTEDELMVIRLEYDKKQK